MQARVFLALIGGCLSARIDRVTLAFERGRSAQRRHAVLHRAVPLTIDS